MNTTRSRKTASNRSEPATATTVASRRIGSDGPAPVGAPRPPRNTALAESAPAKPKRKLAHAVIEAAPLAIGPRRAKRKSAAEPAIDLRVRDAVLARLDAMKANDLKVIDVRGKTSVTDCLVIASGTSTRHVKSMGDEVVVAAKKLGMAPLGVEGEKEAEWILVDLGDTVVHVMLPRTREFYGLERLWTLAEEARVGASA
ncbi:MAG: hypothetical protein AMXMBFR25_10430 [Lysobacterales bacterium]|nr:Ribosomal silencing factor RsfS [Xanthomonadales bacterium]